VETEQLSEWLWCLRTPAVQAYAVREGDGFNLIDTLVAGQADAIVDALAAIDGCTSDEVKVYEIALTHGHDDHRGSAAALAERTGAAVVAADLEAPAIEGAEALPPPTLRDWEQPIWEMFGGKTPAAPAVSVQRRVRPGERLAWERVPQVVGAPGHTPGSVAFWFEHDCVLVAGDAIAIVADRPVSGVFNVDPALADQTFAALADLAPEIACFGHGDPIRDAAGTKLRAAAARGAPGPSASTPTRPS
jgi:glyoxylase-like metal-dependent hydrolase (beta-lactamase superfamily II)